MGELKIIPSVIESRKENLTNVDIYSRLMTDRIIFLGSSIDSDVASNIQAQLLYLDSINHDPIQLYINSPGGLVSAGLGIYDTIKFIKSPVYTTCVGMCASMAAILLAAGEPGHRSALPHSSVMIHQPSSGVFGMASDIEIEAKEIGRLKKVLEELFAADTGKDVKKVHKDMDRDYWLSAEEALNYGIIDNIC